MKRNSLIYLLSLYCLFACSERKQKPDDFDQFWEQTVNTLGTSVEYEIVKDTVFERKHLTLNKVKSYEGVYFYAWMATPKANKKYPVKVRFSGFGRGNTNKNNIPHKSFLKEKDFINVVVDIRGQGLSTEQIKFNGYLTKGLNSAENYIYRGAFMDAVKAVDFAEENPKSEGNIIATGGGQGGALSIVATALNPKVTMCVVEFPFLTDLPGYNQNKWPMKVFIRNAKKRELKYDEMRKILSYYDMINFADKIDTPIFIRTQERDSITDKEGSIKFFIKIDSSVRKTLFIEPCGDHGCSAKSSTANKMERIFIKDNLKRN